MSMSVTCDRCGLVDDLRFNALPVDWTKVTFDPYTDYQSGQILCPECVKALGRFLARKIKRGSSKGKK